MSVYRPTRLVGVVGTNTEVGKTWATAHLLRRLRAHGTRVSVRKPVQSFAVGAGPTDAELLAAASGERIADVCPPHRSYALAMAPPMASDALGLAPIQLDELLHEMNWPADAQIGFIETVGGVCSPLAHNGDSIDLLKRAAVDELLLVADAGLGVINSVRLALRCIQPLPATVLLNRYAANDDLHRRNRDWLLERECAQVIVDVADWR